MAREAVGSLAVIIGANAMPFDRELARVQREASAFGSKMAGSTTVDLARNAGPRAGGGFDLASAAGFAGGAVGAAGVAALTAGLGAARMAADALAGSVSAVADGMASVGDRAIRLAAAFEVTAAQFETLTGSAERGRAILQDIDNLAIKTPFGSKELADTGAMLMGSGVAMGQIIPTLSRLGDIAGGDAVKLQRLGVVFSQVLGNARMNGGDLIQFLNAGVFRTDFARAARMSVSEFNAAMEAGKIGPEVMLKAINELTTGTGRYAGGNERASRTVMGQWNSLTESVDVGLRKLGLAAFEAFDVAPTVGRLADAAQEFQGYIDPIAVKMREVADVGRAVWSEVVVVWNAGSAAVRENAAAVAGLVPTMREVKDGVIDAVRGFVAFTLDAVVALGPFITDYVITPLGTVAHMLIEVAAVAATVFAELDHLGGVERGESPFDVMADGLRKTQAGIEGMTEKLRNGSHVAADVARDMKRQLGAVWKEADRNDWRSATGNGDFAPEPVKPPVNPFTDGSAMPAPPKAADLTAAQRRFLGIGENPWVSTGDGLIQQAERFGKRLTDVWNDFRGGTAALTIQPQIKVPEIPKGVQDFGGRVGLNLGKLPGEMLKELDAVAAQATEEFEKTARAARDRLGPDATRLQRFQLETDLNRQRLDKGLITPQQFELRVGKDVMGLEREFSHLFEQKLPAALTYGTQQAESVITKAIQGPSNDPMKRVEQVLEGIKKHEGEIEKRAREAAAALKNIEARVTGVGF